MRGKTPRALWSRAALLVAALVTVIAVAACGSSSSTSKEGSEETKSSATETKEAAGSEEGSGAIAEIHKIFGPGGKAAGEGLTFPYGMLLAVTGTGAVYGKVMSHGAKLAAQEIEEAGGPKFEIFIGNHESGLIPPGVSATREEISADKIQFMATSFGAVSEAIAPIVGAAKVMTFNGGGASPGQLKKPYMWMSRMIYADAGVIGTMDWAAKKFPEDKRMAIVGTKENGLEATEKIIPEDWSKIQKGGVVTGKAEYFEVGTSNFGPTVARIKSENPQIIYSSSFGGDSGKLIKALREAGITVPVLLAEYTPETCEIGGSAWNHVYVGADFFDAKGENPWDKVFVPAYEAKYKEEPELYAANYYEMMFNVWEDMERVIKKGGNPLSSEQLNAELEKDPEFKSLYGGSASEVGTIKFELKEHTIEKPMAVYDTSNCKPVELAVIKEVKSGEPLSAGLVEELK